MEPGDLAKLFNKFFSQDEQKQIMNLENKPFEERMDNLANIFEKNAKIPANQGKIMAQAIRDPEIRSDIKEIEDIAASGNFNQMQLMQKSMEIAIKMKRKFGS